jgi:hypothetical protein
MWHVYKEEEFLNILNKYFWFGAPETTVSHDLNNQPLKVQ